MPEVLDHVCHREHCLREPRFKDARELLNANPGRPGRVPLGRLTFQRGRVMSVEAVFLHDVWQSPDEDAPRLIYADWLTDQVEPAKAARGDFIRLQCRRAGLDPDDPDAPEMLAL